MKYAKASVDRFKDIRPSILKEHLKINGTTFVGPDTSEPGTFGVNAGKATKDVRQRSQWGKKPTYGRPEDS